MSLPGTFLEIAIRVTLILIVGLAAAFLMRKASASARHLVLLVTIFLSVLLPAIVGLIPRVDIPLPREQSERVVAAQQAVGLWMTPSDPALTQENSASSRATQPQTFPLPSPAEIVGAILLIGMIAQVLRVAAGFWALRVIRRTYQRFAVEAGLIDHLASRLGLPSRPEVFISDRVAVAFLMGWWRPLVMLPATATTWTEENSPWSSPMRWLTSAGTIIECSLSSCSFASSIGGTLWPGSPRAG